MNDVLLVTTPSVEGAKIEQYLGVINCNQVAGTGFLTDLIASFSDLFGGNSGAYRESMNRLCNDAMVYFKENALRRGANAIVGVKIDFDSISAKGMSMFMVSLQGTAVKLSYDEGFSAKETVNNEVLWRTLYCEISKKAIQRKLTGGESLTDKDWDFLKKNPCPDLYDSLYQYFVEFVKSKQYCKYEDLIVFADIDNYMNFLGGLPYSAAIEYVYRNADFFKVVIRKNRLFNASKILEIAKQGNLSTAISLISATKSSYSPKDLEEIMTLKEYLNDLPKVGRIESVDGGLFSSGGQKFICSCGKKNDINAEYCVQCGKNIYGITKAGKKSIDWFNDLADALSDIMSKPMEL